jgi:ribonuclease-3
MARWDGPLKKIDDYRWEIPREYKSGMRVPGLIYASEDMLDSIREEQAAEQVQGNFKSLLQQHSQQHFNATPVYELLDEKGPDHNKCFEVGVTISHRHFPSAWGINKKEAEQLAAFKALVELGVLPEEAQP